MIQRGKNNLPSSQLKFMQKIAILITLTMLLASLAGCAGYDNDDNSPVGDWYIAESLLLEINQDGTVARPDETGTWSTEGDYLTINFDDSVTLLYKVEGDWLWIRIEGEEGCIPFAPEMIDEDQWDDRVSEMTPPSICEE